jgi:sensor histidine kinase YesM
MAIDGLTAPSLMTLPCWLFIRSYFSFLDNKFLRRSMDGLTIVFLSLIFLVAFNIYDLSDVYWLLDIAFFLAYVLIVLYGISGLKDNTQLSKIFLISWFVLLIGSTIYVFMGLGIIQYSIFKLYLMPIGVALETVILSFALGYRIRILKKEKEESEYVLSLEKEKSQEQSAEHKESQLKSLRGQLNPHFVFNALNSIQNFLTKDHKEKADVFLSKFATLMRRSLDLTSQRFIPISKEISFLQDYLKIEELRFEDKFNYTFSIDKHFKKHDSKIPPLLTQPFLENAIKHAFPDDKSGTIDIKFIYDKPSHRILVVIEDNGVGLKPNSMTNSESKGIEITRKRIKIINSEDHNYQISLSIINKSDASNNTGVIVQLDIPDLN